MNVITETTTTAPVHGELDRDMLQAVEGVLQRINYRTGELKMVSPGRVWYFKLDPNCQLYFDDKEAILRCFHPLDPVRVVFRPAQDNPRAQAVYAWEKVYA
jgi:hypothetical protein